MRRVSLLRNPLLAAGLVPMLLLTLALAAGCDATDDIDNFDATVTGTSEIPGATPLDLILGSFPLTEDFTRLDITQAQGFRNDKYSKEDVDSVHLERLTMRVLDPPSGQDLAFLGTVVFYLEVDGLPRLELARQDEFPEGQTSVDFDISARGDLSDYLLAPEVTVEVEALDSQRPPQTTTIEIEAVFDVDVNVI